MQWWIWFEWKVSVEWEFGITPYWFVSIHNINVNFTVVPEVLIFCVHLQKNITDISCAILIYQV